MMDRGNLWVMRHGETEWTITKAHTGRKDIEMTEAGRESARMLGRILAGRTFALVLSSPLRRALETCRLAGYGDGAIISEDLCEWDYGEYEGRTPEEIMKEVPGWSIWKMGVPGGETLEQVALRARRTIERANASNGNVALFAHGHFLRILTACWLGLPPDAGQYFMLDTSCYGILGHERGRRVIRKWNVSPA